MRAVLRFLIAVALSAVAAAATAAPKVVVTIAPVHSLVAALMPADNPPYLLLPPGASPHTHSLRPSQARQTYNADLLIRIGGSLETSLNAIVDNLPGTVTVLTLLDAEGMRVLALDDGDDEHGDGHGDDDDGHDDHGDGHGHDDDGHDDHGDDHDDHGDGHGDHGDDHDDHADEHDDHDDDHGHDAHDHAGDPRDPHIWLDPANARAIVAAVTAALAAMDAANAAAYRANAADLSARLADLEGDVAARVAPVRGRPYVVFHNAWRYFEARFGLRPVAVVTRNPERSPGARSTGALRAAMARAGTVCLFTEPQFPVSSVAALTGDGVRHAVLDPLGAALVPGGELYFQLLTDIADSLRGCLHR